MSEYIDVLCSKCLGGGELIGCDFCSSSYHHICLQRRYMPLDSLSIWKCPLCRIKEKATFDFRYPTKSRHAFLKHITSDHKHYRGIYANNVDRTSDSEPQKCLSRAKTSDKKAPAISRARVSVGPPYMTHGLPPHILDARNSNMTYDIKLKILHSIDRRRSCYKIPNTFFTPMNAYWRGRDMTKQQAAMLKFHIIKRPGLGEVMKKSNKPNRRNASPVPSVSNAPTVLPPWMAASHENNTEFGMVKVEQNTSNQQENDLKIFEEPYQIETDIRILGNMDDECELVWSINLLRKLQRRYAGKPKPGLVRHEYLLDHYIEQCKRDWPPRFGYPFQADFALQLLHTSGYNMELAFHTMHSPDFDFFQKCNVSKRPYLNKWHPIDERAELLTTPFPWHLK